MILSCSKLDPTSNRQPVQGGMARVQIFVTVCAAALLGSLAHAQTQYRSAEEAWRVGVAFLSTRMRRTWERGRSVN